MTRRLDWGQRAIPLGHGAAPDRRMSTPKAQITRGGAQRRRENYVVVGGDFVAQLRGFAVDGYPAVVDPFFHFAARADAGRGKHFLQAFLFP